MILYEYKVVPAPRRGEKARGVKTTPDRFALALSLLMNRLGQEGWEYQRADTLPCDERVGLTGSKTTFQAMLVFRRPRDAQVEQVEDMAPATPPLLASPPETAAAPALGAATAPTGAAPQLGPAEEPKVAAE
jgi:hypothetical protein